MSRRTCMLVIAVTLGRGRAGCDRAGADGEGRCSETTRRPQRYSQLKGVVRKVDVASGEVTIAHEDVPGFMPKMTMPFTLKDTTMLNNIQPGDVVEGPLKVIVRGRGSQGR